MSSKDIAPKIHLFSELEKIDDTNVILVLDSNGDKYKTTIKQLKELLNFAVLNEIELLRKEITENKVTKEFLLSLFNKDKSVTLGVPFNIKGNVGIESKGNDGTIYSTKNEVRVKLGNTWYTLFKTE